MPVGGTKPDKADVSVRLLSDDRSHHLRCIEPAPMLVIGHIRPIVRDIVEPCGGAEMLQRDIAECIMRGYGFPLAEDRGALIKHRQVGDEPAIRQPAPPDGKIKRQDFLQVPEDAPAKFVRSELAHIMIQFQKKIANLT